MLKPKIKKIRDTAERMGRDPATLTVISLLTVVTAATDAEAQAKYADYRRYASHDGALALYGGWSGLDLSGYVPRFSGGCRQRRCSRS